MPDEPTVPGPGEEAAPPPEAAARRSGRDVARQALAAARAEARRRGLMPGRPTPLRDGGTEDRAGERRRWRRVTPEERSGAHPDDRDPQPLNTTLDRLVAERGWQTDKAVGDVMSRWASIVGAEVAAHATPVSFEGGELVLAADSTAWATQMRLLTPTLLARLAEDLGAGVVTSVAVRGPTGPSWKRGPLSVRGRGPRDTYG